jgi:hypothetical protein
LICPVIPFVSDIFPLLEALMDKADRIWVYGLSVQDPSELSWRNVQAILERHFPDQREMIEGIVLDKEHSYWVELRKKLEGVGEAEEIDLRAQV